ncbi:hypothetical protein TP70_09045 [Staphylococcus microti]|uniref:Putative staphylococcal protein n=1 Tax=Staphylococcus microti TaxID=569857 RepID=A0A0D6XPM4_9STAP|nr:hypothetical protein [Staphylococcus microti]KIX90186.1 hypothetical protein TP70_09045 [Staphylococcus microti]PNZ81064.1 hypothetical protein CD132_07310 [Staphylococcus microti]SUM57512.1 putative staphylococcal protein [Staphylococcus microti]
MSMGFIIFLITIAISIFSALGDKQHEKRQKQQPPRPQKPIQTEEKGFFEKVQDTLAEIEETFSVPDEPKPEQPKAETPQQTSRPERKVVERVERPQTTREEAQPAQYTSRRNDEEQERQRLQDMIHQRMHQLDDELHRERQKQLARIERRAKAIIEDQYLSNRTKAIKLEALMNASNVKASAKQGLSFSDNEVINGMIWSEILNKPKQL